MKHAAITVALITSLGLITLDAQKRITTNPGEPYLKRLFPNAVAFSAHGGTPLHYKAYAVDPKSSSNAPPIGLVFWTTDVVANEFGYHGPIHLIVGMDMTGIITGAF